MLYEVRSGPCLKSFGIDVARTAKFPPEIISEAEDISARLERGLTHSSIFTSSTGPTSVPVNSPSLASSSSSSGLTTLGVSKRPLEDGSNVDVDIIGEVIDLNNVGSDHSDVLSSAAHPSKRMKGQSAEDSIDN